EDGSCSFIAIIYEQTILVSLSTPADIDFTAGLNSLFSFVAYDWVKERQALRQITKFLICRFYLRHLKAIAIFNDSLPTRPNFRLCASILTVYGWCDVVGYQSRIVNLLVSLSSPSMLPMTSSRLSWLRWRPTTSSSFKASFSRYSNWVLRSVI